MHTLIRIAGTIVLVALFGAPTSAGLPEIDVMLNLELLLVSPSGAYPMTTTELNATLGGKFHEIVELDKDTTTGERLVYSLAHRMAGAGRIELTLERTMYRGREQQDLPRVIETISTLDSWTTKLLDEDDRLGGELNLRVVPVLRQRKFDSDFDGWRVGMRLQHGPLLEYVDGDRTRPGYSQDRVAFRAVNTPGALGLHLGIPDFGVIRVSHLPFKSAAKCGWVRGTRYHFAAGARSFYGWSDVPILPDDPQRPGKGWTLYCAMDPDPPSDMASRSFYGVFDPAQLD